MAPQKVRDEKEYTESMAESLGRIEREELQSRIRDEVEKWSAALKTKERAESNASGDRSPLILSTLRRLDADLDHVAGVSNRIGEPPPGPPSIRARIAALLMRMLGKLLWWYTHEIQGAISALLTHLHQQVRAIELVSRSVLRSSGGDAPGQFHSLQSRLEHLEQAQLRLQTLLLEDEGSAPSKGRQSGQDTKQALAKIADLELALERISSSSEHVKSLLRDENAERKEQSDSLTTSIADLASKMEELERSATKTHISLSELGLLLTRMRTELTLQDRRIGIMLAEARKRLPEPFDREQTERISTPWDYRHDSLYLAFEDAFRGTRDEIKNRQRVYLPVLSGCDAGVAGRPVLDLGCGRGEWLELLRENGLEARGVDRNEQMAAESRKLGLDVVLADARQYLDGLPDNCLGAVTAFHVVEHLPFESVLELIDNALRVLKSGGLLILETPNPQNVLVGSTTFYYDPTHLRPLPSGMLRFFVEARGFCDVVIQELHPYPAAIHFPEDASGIGARLNDLLYGPQDFGIIGRKV